MRWRRGGGDTGENGAWESRSSSGRHSSPPHNFPALADHNTSVTPPDPSASSGTFQHQRPTPFAGYDGAHGAEAWTRANFGAGAQLPSIRTAQGWGVDMLSTHHYGTGGRASCGSWNVGTTSDGLAAGDTAADAHHVAQHLSSSTTGALRDPRTCGGGGIGAAARNAAIGARAGGSTIGAMAGSTPIGTGAGSESIGSVTGVIRGSPLALTTFNV